MSKGKSGKRKAKRRCESLTRDQERLALRVGYEEGARQLGLGRSERRKRIKGMERLDRLQERMEREEAALGGRAASRLLWRGTAYIGVALGSDKS